MINIIQHSEDGFGHQLHGLFSCLILHNIKNYNFDGYTFINKKFKFDHLTLEEGEKCKMYLIEIVKLFIEKNNIQQKKYNSFIYSHEIYNILDNYDENKLYGLDNAYYFDRIKLNDVESKEHYNNIDKINPLFINKYLPQNQLKKNNIVFHFRLGDAMTSGRGNSINNYNTLIIKLIDILIHKYKNYTYYMHTDGDIKFIENKLNENNLEYFILKKNTPILNVLSDFIYSNIFICGNSGLSKVCSFLGQKELIIINDDNKHSMPLINIHSISNYIEENKI